MSSEDQTTGTGVLIAGRYKLQGKVAAGGMAVVHRAHDLTTGQAVALKRLHRDAPDPAVALFRREYHTLMQLKHPRIIEVYDYGVEGCPFYTMELLDGQDLSELSPLPVKEACRHLRDVASSLALLHARRLLHRDVSPRNVRITSEGRAKLIDFGAMATFGANTHIVGTPVGVPPEALHGLELDQRSDIYALGAVAYYVLTGKHAYAARSLHALPLVWQAGPPPPPSDLVSEVPPELDDLVRSMLSLDMMARPSSAAEVIARLDAIVEPEVASDEDVSAAYLQSPQLIGRNRELSRIAHMLSGLQTGSSFVAIIDGAAGAGRSRLLAEGVLQAQLSGCRVLRLDAERSRGPLGLLRALLSALASLDPDRLTTTMREHGPHVGHLVPELPALIGAAQAALPKDRSERAGLVQRELVAVLTSLCAEQALVLAIDNAHAADEASLSTLVVWLREAPGGRAGIWLSRRDREPVTAAQLMRELAGTYPRMRLRGLDRAGTGALVGALFGQVDYAERMGKWLYEATGGNVGHCISLAGQLVDAGRITFHDGRWVLPAEHPEELNDVDMSGLHEQRLAGLSSAARTLADAISVEPRELPLSRCLLLSRMNEEDALAGLSELVEHGILVANEAEYRFSHKALREHIQASLPVDKKKALHQRVAEIALQIGTDSELGKIDAGFHMLHGETPLRGAELLDEAGMKLVTTIEGLRYAAPGLEAALEVYEREGRSDWALLPLLDTLTAAGWYVDYSFTQRYGHRTLDLALKLSGLSMADALSRGVGEGLALKVGTVIAATRHGFKKKQIRHRQYRKFIGIFTPLVGSVGIMIGVAANTFNGAEARRVLRKASLMQGFPEGNTLRVMYDYARYYTLVSEGRFGEAEPIGPRVLEWFKSEAGIEALTAEGSKALAGGILTGMVNFLSLRDDTDPEPLAEELESLGLSFYSGMAVQARFCRAMRRGYVSRARSYREHLERLAVQGGTTWQASLVIPLISAGTAARSGDIVELRQWTESMSRLGDTVPVLRSHATVYRAQLMLLGGQPQEALAMLDRVREATGPHQWMEWPLTQAIRARTLVKLGRVDDALQVVQVARALLHPSDAPYNTISLDLDLAEIEALRARGDLDQAGAKCDQLLEAYKAYGSPLTMSLLHEARAGLSLDGGDTAGVEFHREELERHAREADNSTLIAKAKRLERAVRRTFGMPGRSDGEATSQADTAMQILLSELEAAPGAERPEAVLRLLLERTGAAAGHLYLREGSVLSRVVSIPSFEQPPLEIAEQLQYLLPQGDDDDEDMTMTAMVAGPSAAPTESGTMGASGNLDIRPLVVPGGGPGAVIGAVVLRRRPDAPLEALSPGALSVIASALARVCTTAAGTGSANAATAIRGRERPAKASSTRPPRPDAVGNQ